MMPIIPENEDEKPFSPETLGALAKGVEEYRLRALFDTDEGGADPFAEQHYLLALSLLEQAERHFKLAALSQARGLTK